MTRLSIEITPEQHKRLKAVVALRGQSIKDYMLERSISPIPDEISPSDRDALNQLEDLIIPRIEAAERGELSNKTFTQIKYEIKS